MKKMMKVLRDYKHVCSQFINLSKSYFYLHEKMPTTSSRRIKKKVIGIAQSVIFVHLPWLPNFLWSKKKFSF